MSNTAIPSPTIQRPDVVEDTITPDVQQDKLTEMNSDVNSMADTLQTIGNVTESALKGVTGLLANIASYNSIEKVDYDADGNQIVDGIGLYKKRYRSTANLSENEDIAKAIAEQEKELKDARNKKNEIKLTFITEEDILNILEETNDILRQRIFGPMWENWTDGKDFIKIMKDMLEDLIDTFDPLMDLVDQLQEYFNSNLSGLNNVNISMYKSKSGRNVSLPLGAIALKSLNTIIDYIRSLIENLERLAEEYTVEELNVLLRKGTSGSNYGTLIKFIQDLIQMIINAIKPYIHNLVIALILDAVDMIVDVLDKAGLLSPKGPLKLIPIAITLIRSIMAGNLEAIEEMVKQSVTKLINMIQLAMIATKDPSILWADTDRMDKEIAVARFKELAEDEDGFTEADKDKFLFHTETNFSAGARHFLQKMKGETRESFNQVTDYATTYSDLTTLYKNTFAAKAEKEQNQKMSKEKLQEISERKNVYRENIAKCMQEDKGN